MLDSSTLSRDSTLNMVKDKTEDFPSYKVLIVGDSGIGKTSLIRRYIYDKFIEQNDSNLGLDFKEKVVQVSPKDKIILILWDTAGSEKFHSIAQNFFTNCDGIILCFDTNNYNSFQNLKGWVDYINEYIEIKDDENNNNINYGRENEEEEEEEEENEWIDDEQFKPVLALAGTKSDLKKNQIISLEEINKFSQNIKCEYFETSSKEGNGIEDLFFFVAKELFEKKIITDKNKKGFKLGNDKKWNESQSNSKIGCC